MIEQTKRAGKSNWMANVAWDKVLSRCGPSAAAASSRPELHGPGSGFSVV